MSIIKNLHSQPERTKTYLAIEIGVESVKAAVWEIISHKPQVIQTGSIEEVNPESAKDLLVAVDSSVSKAQTDISPEPEEVIFSLPESWVKEDGIDDSKKPLLKELTQKLALKAIGFVVITDAIINYLKHKQGSPPTTILLGLSEIEVAVTIVKNGNPIGTQTVGRSDDLVADVEEGIARFNHTSNLPSSMILYDGHTDLETEKQNLTSYNWQERLPFLHIPKIDSLLPDETVRAVAIAGGYEVIATQAKSPPDVSTPQIDLAVDSPDSSEISSPTDKSQDTTEIPDMSSEFGFSPSALTTGSSSLPPSPSSPIEQPEAKFVVNNPASDTDPEFGSITDAISQPHSQTPTSRSSRYSHFKPNFLKKMSLSSKLSFIKLPQLKLPLLIPLGIFSLLLIFAVAAYAYWNFPTAHVVIKLTPNTVDADMAFAISPNISEPDIINSVIPGQVKDVTVTGSAETQVTGEKLVGEPSRGTVTIFNRTTSTKTFPQGTRITGPDSLGYTLDQEITIASASTKENPDLSITTNPSQADVAVSAVNIGANFNLGSGTEFKVANFDSSSYLARAKTDLTGGTSRQITAVSQQDIDTLYQQLLDQLNQQATQEANQTSVGNSIGAVVIPDTNQEPETTYSAQLGEEAQTLTIDGTLSLKIMTYRKSDVSFIIEKVAKDSITQNFQLERSESDFELIDSKLETDGALSINAKAKAKIIPIIDPQDIISNIKGRRLEHTAAYFDKLPNFAKVEIDIQPQLPARLHTFPRKASNITVEIETID